MINSPATDRQQLMEIASAVLETLHEPVPLETVAAPPSHDEKTARDIISNSLVSALDWARLEQQAGGPSLESVDGVVEPYIPSNQALSLIQSAYDEYMETVGITEVPFDSKDPGFATIAVEKLKAIARGKHPFIPHTSHDSFRYDLPANAVVALFGDWGTGEPRARRVMQQIKLTQPTHAIHLGDVYYSGTPEEVQKHFLSLIAESGPSPDQCKYFSLAGNHDLYSGGYGYFDSILPAFGQQASYFNLRNPCWQLIGLDSGYEEYGLQDPQKDWLAAQLSGEGPKSILMSHHQLFSPYDARSVNRPLLKKVAPLLPQIYAWFWGHEHRCIVMGDHLGIKARCIGHGAMPGAVPFGSPQFPDVPVVKVDERNAPPPDGGVIHGFALLRFDGPKVHVSYIDEFGGEFFAEDFQA